MTPATHGRAAVSRMNNIGRQLPNKAAGFNG